MSVRKDQRPPKSPPPETREGGGSSVLEHLPHRCKALGLTPQLYKMRKEKKPEGKKSKENRKPKIVKQK
jgi:hypothetical protein